MSAHHKFIVPLLFIAALAVPATASAEEGDAEAEPTAAVSSDAKMLGVDGAVVLPVGDWSDGAGVGFGPLIRVDIPFRDRITFTARGGYIHHLSKELEGQFGGVDVSSAEIPILGGVKRTFGATGEWYAGAEMGLVIIRVSQELMGESESDSNTELGLTLGGGWKSGKLDIKANLFFPDIGEIGDITGLMVSAGYDFSEL